MSFSSDGDFLGVARHAQGQPLEVEISLVAWSVRRRDTLLSAGKRQTTDERQIQRLPAARRLADVP